MRLGIDLSLTRLQQSGSAAAPVTIAAPFSRVNGPSDDPFTAAIAGSFEGWSVNSVSAIANDTAFTNLRQGYDAAGSATTYLDTMYVSRKLRQPAPNDASLSTSSYALTDYIYSTDAPSGSATNNSTLTSPTPVCNWLTLARSVVGTTISGDDDPVELTVWHRDARSGREAACVIYKISDGVTTASVTVSTTTLSARSTDKNSVIVFRLPQTDISSLSDGLITVNAEVYPWIGASASVAKSATDGNSLRGFSPRYYRKNATLLSTPPFAVVALAADIPNGVGTPGSGGVVSTTLSLAKATPFDTFKNAMDGLQTALGGGATGIDGAIIYFCDGTTHALASPTNNMTQKIAAITLQRAPWSTSRAAVAITSGTAVVSPKMGTSGSALTSPITEGCIKVKDITWQRSGAQALLTGGASQNLQVHWDDIQWDRNGQTSTLLNNTHLYINGAAFTATGNHNFGGATAGEMRLIRGCDIDLNASVVENWLIVGSIIRRPGSNGIASFSTRVASGLIFAFNKVLSPTSTTVWQTNGGDCSSIVNSQNVYEWTTVTSGHSFSIANDSTTYSARNVICHCNTYAGYFNVGRENVHYDEGNTATSTTPGTAVARSSQFASHIGEIHCAIFTKGDRFQYYNGTGDLTAGNRLGNWNYLYGVGCKANFAQFMANGPLGTDNQTQVYPGLWTTPGEPNAAGVTFNNAAVTNTGQTVRNDPKFTDYKGTTWSGTGTSGTAGAGGGTYTLQNTSPAKSMVVDPPLSHTLDGVARQATNDHCGALSAA